jgi:hypothetical protein
VKDHIEAPFQGVINRPATGHGAGDAFGVGSERAKVDATLVIDLSGVREARL